MKRNLSFVFITLLCFILAGCAKTYHGTDELMEKARQELPVSDADTIEMQYAGMCGEDDRAIAWFISGNEYQAHYYLPMEVEITGNGANYTFVHTYKPLTDRCSDVAVVNWNQGYAFLINNPKVAAVKITMQNGETVEETIKETMIPYAFYVQDHLSEYIFLDSEGNEVK